MTDFESLRPMFAEAERARRKKQLWAIGGMFLIMAFITLFIWQYARAF